MFSKLKLAEFPNFSPYLHSTNSRSIVDMIVINPTDGLWYPVKMVYDTGASATVFMSFSNFAQRVGKKEGKPIETQANIAGMNIDIVFWIMGPEIGIGGTWDKGDEAVEKWKKDAALSGYDGVLSPYDLAPYLDSIYKDDKVILKTKGDIIIPPNAVYARRSESKVHIEKQEPFNSPEIDIEVTIPSTGLSKILRFVIDTGSSKTIIKDLDVLDIGIRVPPSTDISKRKAIVKLKGRVNNHSFPILADIRIADPKSENTIGMLDLLASFDILIRDEYGVYLIPKTNIIAISSKYVIIGVGILLLIYFIRRNIL